MRDLLTQQNYAARPGRQMVRRGIYASYFVYDITFNFTAASQVINTSVPLLGDADFELMAISDNHAATYNVEISDAGSGLRLTQQPIPIANLAGNGLRPGILPCSHIFPKDGSIIIDATNGATAANAGHLTLIGARLFQAGADVPADRIVYSRWHIYTARLQFTAVGQIINTSISTLSDSDYELYILNRNHASAFTYTIRDESSGAQLSNVAVPAESTMGSAQYPGVLPVSYSFRKNSTISISATNGTTAANDGYISFIGAHVYDVTR